MDANNANLAVYSQKRKFWDENESNLFTLNESQFSRQCS